MHHHHQHLRQQKQQNQTLRKFLDWSLRDFAHAEAPHVLNGGILTTT
jgi:hypothetical protein